MLEALRAWHLSKGCRLPGEDDDGGMIVLSETERFFDPLTRCSLNGEDD